MKFIIGVIIGYNIYKGKVFYAYVKENPEDPQVIEFKQNLDKVKAAWKQAWASVETKAEFDKIISENKLENDKS